MSPRLKRCHALLAAASAAALLMTATGPASAAPTVPVPITVPAATYLAPSGLGSSAQTLTSARFSWGAVAGAPRYRLMLATNPQMTGAVYYSYSGTSAEVTGLKSGTTYYAKVRVISALGDGLGPYSAAVAVKTKPDPNAVFTIPSGVKAVGEGTALRVSWNEVASAEAYRLRVSDRPDMVGAKESVVKEPAGRIEGLLSATTYYAQVQVTSAAGAPLTGYSASATAGTPWAPAPAGLTAKPGQASAVLSWGAVPQAARYRVAYATTADMLGAAYGSFTGLTGTVNGLKPGTTYFFKVKGLKADGNTLTGYSTAVSGKTFAQLPAPTALTAGTVGEDRATIAWTPVPGVAGYRVAYSLSADMKAAVYRDTATPGRTIYYLTPDTAYYVQVRGVDAAGTGITAYSSTLTIRTAKKVLAPSNVTATAVDNDSADLSWAPVAGAAGYRVAYSTNADMSGATYRDTVAPKRTIYYLAPGTAYYVQVRAIDGAGLGISPYSPSLMVKTTAMITAPAGLSVTGGDHDSLDLAWKPVAGAAAYRVAYSPFADMSKAIYRDTATAGRTIYYLTPDSAYYIQVRATDAAGNAITDYSPALQARTKVAPPLPPAGLAVSRATPSVLSLTWGAVSGTTQYRVGISTNADMAGAKSYRFTGPAAEIRGLAADTGFYINVRALDMAGNTLTDYSPVLAARTPKIPVLAPVASPLTVASYNVRCANCTDTVAGEAPWTDRRNGIIANVISRMPDIIGFQETSQGWLKDVDRPGGLSQFEDLREGLNAAGGSYALTNDKRNNCVNPQSPSGCVYADQGASLGTRIFYNADKVSLVRSGSKILPELVPLDTDRYVAWAEVVQLSTGKHFFFADTHLEARKEDGYVELRRQQAQTVMDVIARENAGQLPVILVGDMNSSKYVKPSNSAYDVIVGAGLVDPLGNTYWSTYASGDATAEKVINGEVHSFNGYSRLAIRGAPGTLGSYLDYIFTSKMRVQSYEHVAAIDSAGNYIGAMPSDHNMLFAVVGLP